MREVRVAGRLVSLRLMGKAGFAHLQGSGKRIQIYVKKDVVGDRSFELFHLLDLGDSVGVRGHMFRTKTNELSVWVEELTLLSKALLPLPEKWHGLTDIELRYRQRYLDLIANEKSREVFVTRARIIQELRRFFDARGYIEVETPMMHPIVGGAAARPFTTHHNALDIDLFLRIAPELYLKRLVVGGFERVYEINRNFRNEGLSRQHNPEFTMLELYQAYATFTDLMALTEQLVGDLAREVIGSTKVTWDGVEIDVAAPWRRLSIRDAVRELGGIAEASRIFEDPVFAAEAAIAAGVPAGEVLHALVAPLGGGDDHHAAWQRAAERPQVARSIVERYPDPETRRVAAGHLGYLVFEATSEAKLVQPTFLVEYPLAVSPLARKNDRDGAFCDRFELFVHGRELANGFSELNDPDDQRARFLHQVRAKAAGAAE